ncbi:hypothetical protein MARPO_0106s0031 [Marchantia polymorpha]|uniref:Lipoxygenase n=1 Tax=Marchantia polymorpha TaxID=3197 RepID=A0A2R6WD98_MARPO|nr:hypothetical protein MARPO_0106s0031 [Marchantia polymorpha]|eukprot:PTQ31835.1 hypothetical protein MARPO_0106s0031 [Marchantia polymorpha]
MATAAGIVGAIAASAAVPSSSGGQLNQGNKAPARGVGAQSSSFGGKALRGQEASSGKKRVGARSKSTGLQVRAATETSVVEGFPATLARIFGGGGKDDGDTVEVLGKLVLAKKNALDLVDIGAVFWDNTVDMFGRKVFICLVSNEIDPKTNEPKKTAYSGVLNWWDNDGDLVADEFTYSVNFKVPKDFGQPGAILVQNKHVNEFYMKTLTIKYPEPENKEIDFLCNSWVYPEKKYDGKDRIFFSNKTYLPRDTPAGLKKLRELEFQELRGDGTGTRQKWDRVYDYDVYNDLGNVEKDITTKRPILGAGEFKYPRRCRTGRPMCKGENLGDYETSTTSALDVYYVPRDEAFERAKSSTFLASALKGFVHSVMPNIKKKYDTTKNEFDSMSDIFDLYDYGVSLKGHIVDNGSVKPEENGLVLLDSIFSANGDSKDLLVYPIPDVVAMTKWGWKNDLEFGRQFLAGLNPMVIKAVQEYPPKSTLDPKKFPGATALTNEHIECFLEGQTVEEVIEGKRLFTVDYRDLFLPYLDMFHAGVEGLAMYAPRVILYRTKEGHLKPVAIELSLPPKAEGEECRNRVFTPPPPGINETFQLWELAKIHVNSVDFGYHELVSHWLSTHAIMEPFIISTNRNISKLHPIYTLLSPLYKNTMYINSSARQSLIAAKGIIESNFVTGQYSTQISAVVYEALWRFDRCALPNDLLARGMADPGHKSEPGEVKLVLEDYPYAQDGLELWEIISSWVATFVNHVYNSDNEVKSDSEIQTWWNEIVNVGHADKKGESWWPKLNSRASLIEIISTISWITGPHHAAVNFGQYGYAGFMPNRPPFVRRHIPEKGTKEYGELIGSPEKFMLSMMSSQSTTVTIMTTIELLSTHSVDEEYLGKRLNESWTSDPVIKKAYEEFSGRLQTLKQRITERNNDPKLPNRRGPANVPYTLLYPESESGVTGQGVPYSISI